MERLDSLIKKLKVFNRNIPNFVIDSVQLQKKEVFKLIKAQIQNKGINGEGEKIRHAFKSYPIYSDGYENLKRKLGLYTGKVDLTLNGNYLDSMEFVRLNKTSFYVDSNYNTAKGFDLGDHNFNVYPNHLLLTMENRVNVSTKIVQPFLTKKFYETIRI